MVHEMPGQYLMVKADTWQSKKFCRSKIWRSRKCLDIRFAMDLRRFESQERSLTSTTHQLKWSTTNTSQQFNILILYVTQPSCWITHPALVNIKSFSIAEHISTALPKELWLKTDYKTVPCYFFNPYRTDSKEYFDIRFWTELWKSISQIPNKAKVLIINDMFTFFAWYT